MTTTQALYLAREARETVYSLGRAYEKAIGPDTPEDTRSWRFVPMPDPAKRLLLVLRKADARWARREARLQEAIEEECQRA